MQPIPTSWCWGPHGVDEGGEEGTPGSPGPGGTSPVNPKRGPDKTLPIPEEEDAWAEPPSMWKEPKVEPLASREKTALRITDT